MQNKLHLSNKLIQQVKQSARQYSRTISDQVEHWLRIGKAAEENADLPYNFIRDTLTALDEAEHGEVTEYAIDHF